MNNNKKIRNSGISLISLIITIIVIIILVAIIIYTGLNTPDRANFAKFAQKVSDVRIAIMQEYGNMKTQYAIERKTRSDSQIYYTMATGNEIDMNDDTSTLKAGTIDELGFVTVPNILAGSEFYEVTENEKINSWSNNKGYYEPIGTEKHYITDKGEFFILPGYRVVEGDTTKWYVNESKYYESDFPIRAINWNTVMENVQAPSSQVEERNAGVIGIGTDGATVNMDLWQYTLLDDGTFGLNTQNGLDSSGSSGRERGYIGRLYRRWKNYRYSTTVY